MNLTTEAIRLDRSEVVTTLVAATISSGLYVRDGQPYLARGVVGDVVGLAFLATVLRLKGTRARHEALVCLVAIGAVSATRAPWPLRVPALGWWFIVVTVVAAYLRYRNHELSGRA